MPDAIKIIHFPVCESTNLKAQALAAQGAGHGTVILADRQTHGRGRGDKNFFSPEGGLYMSAILIPSLGIKIFSLLTLAAGLACTDAVEKITGLSPLLKWPNDLYVDSMKLAGILTETGPFSQAQNTLPYVVVGIGMNINTERDALGSQLGTGVTSLFQLTHERYALNKFVKEIYSSLIRRILQLEKEQEAVLSLWQKKDYLYGKTVLWNCPGQNEIRGTGMGLTRNGQYCILDDRGKKHAILAGHIRPVSCSLPL